MDIINATKWQKGKPIHDTCMQQEVENNFSGKKDTALILGPRIVDIFASRAVYFYGA